MSKKKQSLRVISEAKVISCFRELEGRLEKLANSVEGNSHYFPLSVAEMRYSQAWQKNNQDKMAEKTAYGDALNQVRTCRYKLGIYD